MQTLFAISVFCFLGILWAVIALARHIKKTQILAMPRAVAHTDFKHHFLAAADKSPIPLESISTMPKVVLRESPSVALYSVVPRMRSSDLNQSVHEIAANKQWTLPPHPVRRMSLPLRRVGRGQQIDSTIPMFADRKPPQPSSRHGAVQRIDPAYFSKDLGDLTDPYQPSRLRVNARNRRD